MILSPAYTATAYKWNFSLKIIRDNWETVNRSLIWTSHLHYDNGHNHNKIIGFSFIEKIEQIIIERIWPRHKVYHTFSLKMAFIWMYSQGNKKYIYWEFTLVRRYISFKTLVDRSNNGFPLKPPASFDIGYWSTGGGLEIVVFDIICISSTI